MIGKGGMAFVYKAYDTQLDRDVALKIIRTDLFGSSIIEQMQKRFKLEAKTLATLNHENIVKVFDYGEYNSTPYLVMEYLPGQTLKQFLSKPIPWEEAIEIILPIAKALKYAHGQKDPVLHRDVKPSNIIITKDKKPYLSDFGIAKVLSSRQEFTLTGTGVGIGTPEYMAPEQGKGEKVDGRVDIYSLGIVLYEMITGRKPFSADTPMAVILKHISDPLPRPKQYIRDLPDEVEKLLFKALVKDPNARFQKMDDFIKAIDLILQKEDKKIRRAKPKEPIKSNTVNEGETIDFIGVNVKNIASLDRNINKVGISPPQENAKNGGKKFSNNKIKSVSLFFLIIPFVLLFFYFQKNIVDLEKFTKGLFNNNSGSNIIIETLPVNQENSDENDLVISTKITFTPRMVITETKKKPTLTQITPSPTITKPTPTKTYFSPTVILIIPTNTFVPMPTKTPVPLPTNTYVPPPTNTYVPVPTQEPTQVPAPTDEGRPPTPTPP